MQKLSLRMTWLLSALLLSVHAYAGTYRCAQGGKTIYSDVPCAHDASRVDGGADSVDWRRRREAENVNQRTKSQLQEIQYEEARARSSPPRAAQIGSTTTSNSGNNSSYGGDDDGGGGDGGGGRVRRR